ncbi:hypothetical protein L195_g058195, partial [Trifolium pratense]
EASTKAPCAALDAFEDSVSKSEESGQDDQDLRS